MVSNETSDTRAGRSLRSSVALFLQDKGKGRDSDGGNYRRNAERELTHFLEWASGERGRDD